MDNREPISLNINYNRFLFNQVILITLIVLTSLLNLLHQSNFKFATSILTIPSMLFIYVWSKRYVDNCQSVALRRRLIAPHTSKRNVMYASGLNINPKRHLCNMNLESQKFDSTWPYNDLKSNNLDQYFVGFLDYDGVHELLNNDGEFVVGVIGDKKGLDAMLWFKWNQYVGKLKILKRPDDDGKTLLFEIEFNNDVQRMDVGSLIRFYVDERREIVFDSDGSKLMLASLNVWKPNRSWYMSSRLFAVEGAMSAHKSVFRGTLKLPSGTINVIIKCPREGDFSAVSKHLLKESRLVRKLNHVNVVKFYGIAVDSFRTMLAVQCGEIDLQKCVRQTDLPLLLKLKFAQDIALGMRHVASKRVLHNDLCALNCVVFKDANYGLIAKVIDFDLAIDMKDKAGFTNLKVLPRIPAPYMSPEALAGFGSEKSDVWQYGLTLWELFTDGCVPYDNYKDESFVKLIMDNGCVLKRASVPSSINRLIKKCLNFRPFCRPSFDNICKMLPVLFTEIDDVCNRLDQIASDEKRWRSVILYAYNTGVQLLNETIRRSLNIMSAGRGSEIQLAAFANNLRDMTGKSWLCFAGDQFAISRMLFDYDVMYFQIADTKFLLLSIS